MKKETKETDRELYLPAYACQQGFPQNTLWKTLLTGDEKFRYVGQTYDKEIYFK